MKQSYFTQMTLQDTKTSSRELKHRLSGGGGGGGCLGHLVTLVMFISKSKLNIESLKQHSLN